MTHLCDSCAVEHRETADGDTRCNLHPGPSRNVRKCRDYRPMSTVELRAIGLDIDSRGRRLRKIEACARCCNEHLDCPERVFAPAPGSCMHSETADRLLGFVKRAAPTPAVAASISTHNDLNMGGGCVRTDELLRRVVKYATEDRARTPGKTRLARVVAEADAYLKAKGIL